MKTTVLWKDGMRFDGRAEGFNVPLDANPPLGHYYGPTPKELLAIALAGCTGMDIIGILKKNHQFVDRLEIETQIEQTKNHPIVFSSIHLIINLEGSIENEAALKAVELSQSKYCGVSAMLNQVTPIKWSLLINGEKVGEGKANFDNFEEVFHSSYDG